MTPYYIRRLVSELKQRENQDNACSTFTTNDTVHPVKQLRGGHTGYGDKHEQSAKKGHERMSGDVEKGEGTHADEAPLYVSAGN